ncbi:MAG: glycosyltransferase [Candidatus Omnitrophica bacterium]|nr:glycosyltransferase [Candidatus Omnitrophota bacterium]
MKSDKTIKVLYYAMVELAAPEGPAVHTMNLIKGFNDLGVKTLLLCPRPPKKNMIPDLKESIFLPFFGFGSLQEMAFDFFSFFYLCYAFLVFRPDVFLIREAEGNLSTLLCACLFRVPLLVDMNGPLDIDYISRDGFHSHFPSFAKVNPAIRWVVSIWRKIWRTFLFKTARGLTSNTASWRDELCEEFRIPKEHFKVVSMYVDSTIFHPLNQRECRKKLNIPESRIVFGYLGSFQPTHEIDVLFDALKVLIEENCNIELHIVGGGRRLETLQVKFKDFPYLDRVRFFGWVPHHEIPSYLSAMNVGVALLKPIKAFQAEAALKFKEYIACGVPVIMNGDPDLFRDYPPGCMLKLDVVNGKGLAAAILKAIPIKTSDDMSRAVEYIKTEFPLKKAAQLTLELLN